MLLDVIQLPSIVYRSTILTGLYYTSKGVGTLCWLICTYRIDQSIAVVWYRESSRAGVFDGNVFAFITEFLGDLER